MLLETTGKLEKTDHEEVSILKFLDQFLVDWSTDAYVVFSVLNTFQTLSVAKTLAQTTPTTH